MAYGLRYKCAFKSNENAQIEVRILKKDYNSAIEDITMGGTPVMINYLGNESKYNIITGSECVLQIFSEKNQQFAEIMLSDAFDFQVQILKKGIMIWSGFVIQDNYSEPYLSAPYEISIRATDGLGNLKQNDFQSSDSSNYLAQMTFIEVIQRCLGKLKNGTQVVTSNDVFESRINRSDTYNEAFNNIKVNPYLFIKDDLNSLKCDVVLQYILEIFNCYIYYKEGKYFIERINYKVNDVLTRRTYNISFDENVSSAVAVSTENIVKRIGRNTGLIHIGDQTITYATPYNKVQIDSDIIESKNILVNNFFRNWNPTTTIPYNWTKLGTLAIAKLTYANTGDALSVTQITTDANLSYTTNMLKANNVNFTKSITGQKLSIKFASSGNARFMVKCSTATKSYYLECSSSVDTGDITDPNFEFGYTGAWKENTTFCKIERGTESRSEVSGWYVSTISDMNLPADIISLEFALLPSYSITNFSGGYRVREFTPTITNSTSTVSVDQRYIVTSTKNNKETYTDLAPSIGEFGNVTLVNQTTINDLSTLDWYRDGKTESKGLLQIAGQSIMNQYREGFMQFSGSLKGDFDFGKVYYIDTLPNKFMPFKANMDLKRDTTSVEFFELLPDNDNVTDLFQKVANYSDTSYTTNADPSTTYNPRGGTGAGGGRYN